MKKIPIFILLYILGVPTINAQKTWKLMNVIHESVYSTKMNKYHTAPTQIEVNEYGGEASFRVEYTKDCVESYTVQWRFDRDIRSLTLGESFNVNLYLQDYGDCTKPSLYVIANAGIYDGWSPISNRGVFKKTNNLNGRSKKVFPNSHPGHPSIDIGHGQANIKVNTYTKEGQAYFHIVIRDNGGAYSGQKDRVFYEIVYLYGKSELAPN